MLSAGLPDARALVPLQCPLSTAVLKDASPLVRVVFAMINEARLNGSLSALADARGMIELEPPERRYALWDDGKLDRSLTLDAAVGDCLSIEGRWRGDLALLQEGVARIKRFVEAVDDSDLGDGGATQIRAHAYLGNALTRLAYRTKDESDLVEAEMQIEGHKDALRKRRRALPEVNAELHASIHRDLGDVHVGLLHWSPETVEIDGKAISSLSAASSIFSELLKDQPSEMRLIEWAATESSLAVAQAKTAELLKTTSTEAGGLLRGRDREEVALGLMASAESSAARVWRVYLGLLTQPGYSIPFRWARTVSNVGFALSYLYMLDSSRIGLGVLAEAAFVSVTNRKVGVPVRLASTEFDSVFFGELFLRGARYRPDDHCYRYDVNLEGLHRLREVL